MHLIPSFGPVSKGLGPVSGRFEIIIFFKKFVRRSYFFGKNSQRTTNQIGVALATRVLVSVGPTLICIQTP